MVNLVQSFGCITSTNSASKSFSIDADTIAGETTSNSDDNSRASTNIDVVGLAVFKGDALVRRTYCYRNHLSFNCN